VSLFAILLLLLFVAAQGAVIYETARVVLHLLKLSQRPAKIAAMLASYVLWIAFTIGIYAVMGGDGGLMDGFGLVLVLCCTALISSFAYLLFWTMREAA